MGIVVSCANLATIYHNTKYSGGKVVNYLHISRKCSGCVRDVFGIRENFILIKSVYRIIVILPK